MSEPALDDRLARRREYQRDWDRKKRRAAGIPEAKPAEHGTRSGYNRHVRERSEARQQIQQAIEQGLTTAGLPDPSQFDPCPACLEANAAYQRQRRAETGTLKASRRFIQRLIDTGDLEACQAIYDDMVAHAEKAQTVRAVEAVAEADAVRSALIDPEVKKAG